MIRCFKFLLKKKKNWGHIEKKKGYKLKIKKLGKIFLFLDHINSGVLGEHLTRIASGLTSPSCMHLLKREPRDTNQNLMEKRSLTMTSILFLSI
jgi:hypothetical protein